LVLVLVIAIAVWVVVRLATAPPQDPAEAGDEPTDALLVLPDGTLVSHELDSGDQRPLAPAPHPGADVIDLHVGAQGTIDDFTAIAYDDGTGPLGFLTYARRDGGEVVVTFTPTSLLPGRHSNRGYRTVSPDGRWLAYVAGVGADRLATFLVPLDPDDAAPQPEQAIRLARAVSPLDWTGDTSPGGHSRITGAIRGGFEQVVLERTDDGFAVVDETVLHDDDPFEANRQVASTSQRPGAADDPRFDLRVHRHQQVGNRFGNDVVELRYHAAEGEEHVLEFAVAPGSGNWRLAAHGRTALATVDHVLDPPDAEAGRGFLVRVSEVDGDVTFSEPVVLPGGPTDAALLAPRR
jgi:hypothetical protein